MFVEILITDEIKKLAMGLAEGHLNASKNGTPKFQTNEIQNKYIGQIGQLIFKQWLEDNQIYNHNYHSYNEDGSSDNGDFKIDGKIVEVKTGQMTWAVEQLAPGYKFFIAEQQLNEPRDIYVNIQLDNNLKFAYITGFMMSEDTKKYNVFQTDKMFNPARGIPLKDLTPIEEINTQLNTQEVK